MTDNFQFLKNKVKEIENWLAKEFSTIRTGRATPVLLDNVLVDLYGVKTPLKQVGAMGVENTRTLRLTLWDKSQTKNVEIALQAANLGVSISADQGVIRIIFPELTADKRKLLSKIAKEKIEQARISLRLERERVWNEIQAKERAGKIPEDEKFRLKNELQKIIDEANKNLEASGARKEAEIAE